MSNVIRMCQQKVDRAMRDMPDLSNKSPDEMNILEKLVHRNRDIGAAIPVTMAIDGMTAGVDTTGNTMAFWLYHLAKNPDKQG